MAFSHSEAKALLDVVEPSLTVAESQAVRAVAHHETKYGEAWPEGRGRGSNNMGAIMTGQSEENCTGFQHPDSNPERSFTGCFKVYPSREAGLKDLVRVMLKSNVRTAANRGDLHGVAAAMFDNHYFTGTSKDPETNILRYETALRNSLDSMLPVTAESDAFQRNNGENSGKKPRGILLLAGVSAILVYGAVSLSKGLNKPNLRAKKG